MGTNITLPELDVSKPTPAPFPDALSEFQRASQLQTAAAQRQQMAAQTQGLQQQNQIQQLQLQDEQKARALAPQFTKTGDNGKPNGFDYDGYYNAMLQGGINPQTIQKMQMSRAELQKTLIGLNDAQLGHQEKVNDFMHNHIQSILDANKDDPPQSTPQAAPQASPQPSNTPVPGTGGMPAFMLPNATPQDIGKAPAGSPESLGQPEPGAAPTQTEAAVQQATENAPRPIGPKAQAAYQKFLVQAGSLGIPVGQFPPMLHDERELTTADASLGMHAEDLKEAQTKAATAKDQSQAAADLWKPAGEGTLVNVQSGQMIHGVSSPNVEAFKEYIKNGGNPLNFASDQAAREASNPALQSAKLHDAIALKSAEQTIADGDPAAAAKLLTDSTVAPNQLISSRKPEFAQKAFTIAAQMQPGWNAQKADADYAVAKSPANLAFFGSAKSLTDPGGTLDQLKAAAKDIPDNQIPVFNSVADAIKASTGSGPIAKYASLALGVADDYSKVMGGGQGSDTSRTQALNLIAAKQSPAQRDASIDGIRGAVGSQAVARIGNNQVLKRMYGDNLPTQGSSNSGQGAGTQQFSHVSASGKFGWDGTQWVAIPGK